MWGVGLQLGNVSVWWFCVCNEWSDVVLYRRGWSEVWWVWMKKLGGKSCCYVKVLGGNPCEWKSEKNVSKWWWMDDGMYMVMCVSQVLPLISFLKIFNSNSNWLINECYGVIVHGWKLARVFHLVSYIFDFQFMYYVCCWCYMYVCMLILSSKLVTLSIQFFPFHSFEYVKKWWWCRVMDVVHMMMVFKFGITWGWGWQDRDGWCYKEFALSSQTLPFFFMFIHV